MSDLVTAKDDVERRLDPAVFPPDGTTAVDHCAAHGRRVARRVDMALQSRVKADRPLWLRLNLLSLAAESGHRARHVKVVKVYGWPLCAVCARRRAAWFGLFLLLLVGSLLTIAAVAVLRRAVGIELPAAGAIGAVAVVALVASPLPFVLGSLPRITGARASDDGTAVLLGFADPRFIEDSRGRVE